jgi:hypothetical protein
VLAPLGCTSRNEASSQDAEVGQGETIVSRVSAVAIWLVALAVPASAQPCNPVIDGTYCAEAGSGARSSSASPLSARIPPIRNIAEDFVMSPDQPATLGAVTFRSGGTKCIGLLRRGACN